MDVHPQKCREVHILKKSKVCLLFGSIWGCYKLIHWIIKDNHIPGQYTMNILNCFDGPMPLNLGKWSHYCLVNFIEF